MAVAQCINCSYFHRSKNGKGEDQDEGQCRVNSPVIHPQDTGIVNDGCWPTVFLFDWCGRFSNGWVYAKPLLPNPSPDPPNKP